MKRKLYIAISFLLCIENVKAHEPLYGLGPETLPKHLSAVEFRTLFFQSQTEYSLAYGFGINQNWTVRAEIPSILSGNPFNLGNIQIKTKYALWRKTQPGVLKRLTAIAAIGLPTDSRNQNVASNITAVTFGLANGYESRRWYYFSDIGYTHFQSSNGLNPGGKLKYNLVGGIRPVKTSYLKPDLVFLVELNGELSRKNKFTGNHLQQTAGNTLAFAPGFLLSYRNIMLKGGIQIGTTNTAYVAKKQTNGLISLEYHF
jgi:hypothetical protein